MKKLTIRDQLDIKAYLELDQNELAMMDQHFKDQKIQLEVKELSTLDQDELATMDQAQREQKILREIEELSKLNQNELAMMEAHNEHRKVTLQIQAFLELNQEEHNAIQLFLDEALENNQINAFIKSRKYIKDRAKYINEYNIASIPVSFKEEYRLKINYCSNFLSENQVEELVQYIYIIVYFNLKDHWVANVIIDMNDDWDSYKHIRSKNSHGPRKTVNGIIPTCFHVLHKLLNLNRGGGENLTAFSQY
ncbi:hypothetical protein [Lewinella sp. IMCC34191]|uniref:hypothetical protein n=1 Tax=Lewinella sp. IMCC34191 TaxID=2259172 RepID=UPI000E260416|nr:hypothetical protein [Lewinella sp. IMCC34191]